MSDYNGVPTIVLGASGFIGRWVARLLNTRGADLTLVVRDAKMMRQICDHYDIRGRVIELDLSSISGLEALFRSESPVITFNLAGYGVDRSERDELTAYAINAGLVERVCKAVAATRHGDWQGQHLVHAGSALEYGAIAGDLVETSQPNPTNLYGKSKLAGARAVVDATQRGDLRGVVGRLFTIYGPGEHTGRLLPTLLEAAKSGATIPLTEGAQQRDFTYVGDAAEGLLRLGLCPGETGGVVNVATGRLCTVRDFVSTAARVLEIPREQLAFGALPTRPEEMNHDDPTIARLQQLTRWRPPTSLDVGIRQTRDFVSHARDKGTSVSS